MRLGNVALLMFVCVEDACLAVYVSVVYEAAGETF